MLALAAEEVHFDDIPAHSFVQGRDIRTDNGAPQGRAIEFLSEVG